MDSIEEKFAEIEKEISKLHSYETPVLMVFSVIKSSKGIKEWMKNELNL